MNLTVCFLHGLLGDHHDWQEVILHLQARLPNVRCVALDLPCHGMKQDVNVEDFVQVRQYLQVEIQQKIGDTPYWLVGYSLGGRLVLDLLAHTHSVKKNLQGVVLEGVNFGLVKESERIERWKNDKKWAEKFCTFPLEVVLKEWYQQGVFAHLTETELVEVVKKRSNNNGQAVANILLATSLAKQPNYLSSTWHTMWQFTPRFLPTFFLCGEKDKKFQQVARKAGLPTFIVKQVGHNTHQENPIGFVDSLMAVLAGKC